MPFPIRLRLRSLLPLLLGGVAVLGFSIIIGFRLAQELGHARTINAEILRGQTIALRNSLSDLLAVEHAEQAERRLLDATLDSRVRTMVLVGADGQVLLSNHRQWLGQPSRVVEGFVPEAAERALRGSRDLFVFSGKSRVIGYFPLEPATREGVLRSQERGLLFVAYDLSVNIEQALHRVRVEGAWVLGSWCLLALLLCLLLDRWVTRKINRMVQTMGRAEKGDMSARTRLAGAGELDALGQALDRLLDRIVSARKELQENLEFQTAVLETIPDVVFVKEAKDLRFVRLNRAAERLFDLDRQQVIGRRLSDFLPERAAAAFERHDRAVLEEGRLIDVPDQVFPARQGSERIVHVTEVPILDAEGVPRYVVGVMEDVTEHRQAEALEKSRVADFRRLLEASPLPVALAAPSGRIEFLSQRFVQDFGYDLADIPDLEHWWSLAHPDPTYREEVRRQWAAALERAADHDGIIRPQQTFDITRRDGSVRTMEIQGTLLGKRLLVIFNDLTERVRDEQRVRDALAFSEKLLSTMPVGVSAYHGTSGRCVIANTTLVRMIGGTWEYHLAQNFRQIPQWQETELLAAAEEVLVTGTDRRTEIHALTNAGRECWLSCLLSSFQSGGEPHLLVLALDITERKRAEETLRASEARFRTLTEQAPIPLFVQQDDRYVYCNPAAVRLLRAGDERAVLGRLSLDIVHPEDRERVGAIIQTRGQEGSKAGKHSERFIALDGESVEVEVMGIPISLGERPAMLVFAEDVTERNRAETLRRTLEQELNRTQKLQSLGSLAGGVAHDMNNVLGAIMNLASLHRDRAPEGSTLRQSMDTITKACLRGGAMVKGLLGFAREGLVEEKSLDLNDLVREEVALLERTTLQKVRLETELATDLQPVKGDPSALAHALMNLCVNAVDAMPEGGTLRLRTRNGDLGTVLLQVADTGCGMPREVLEKALDPFFTTKPQGKGTGLGLSIVYGTVKAHRGQFRLRSAPGEGTTAEIQLPACSVSPEVQDRLEGPSQAHRPRQVLVVDDDDLIQETTSLLLGALGHQATVVGTGEAALKLLEGEAVFDVVILDLNMPGLGGARTLERLRALRPGLPVLLATGRADKQAIELAQAVPLVTLLAKPFSMEELGARLQTWD